MSWTSAKRLRTSEPARGSSRAAASTTTVDALPADVLLLVLRHCTRHEVATSVRRVSRHFSDVAAIFLNDELRKLVVRYEQAAESLAAREHTSKKRPTHLAIRNGRNAFAVIHDQLLMAHAVTWRYLVVDVDIARPRPRTCFYGGRLLDLFWGYLREAEACPILLTASFFYRGLDSHTSEKCALVNACKRFLNHFEKVTEPRLLSHHSDFGAKVLDLLDCLLDAETSLQVVDTSSDAEYLIRASYHVPKSFFTCLQVSRDANAALTDWKEECRFMFMRLRRIVSNSNANFLQSCRLSRERQWRCKPCVYSGFGTSNGKLFYYGCLNHTASVQRAASPDVFTEVDVEVKCPPRLAPFSLYRQRRLWNLRHVRGRHGAGKFRRRRCHLHMSVTCPFSSRNRLPESFSWSLPPCGAPVLLTATNSRRRRRRRNSCHWFPRRRKH